MQKRNWQTKHIHASTTKATPLLGAIRAKAGRDPDQGLVLDPEILARHKAAKKAAKSIAETITTISGKTSGKNNQFKPDKQRHLF